MAGMPQERFAANVSKPMASVATALQLADMGTIDRYLFGAMQSANVAPAAPTNDFEFIRRVTLDLTGRIPPPAPAGDAEGGDTIAARLLKKKRGG